MSATVIVAVDANRHVDVLDHVCRLLMILMIRGDAFRLTN
jgi:hypothetical protein